MPGEAAKSVSRTIGVLSLAKVLTWLSTGALMFVLPRFLGPAEYGKLFLGMSVVGIMQVFVDFGREYSVAKAVTRDREKAPSIVVNAVSARMLIGVVAYCGMIVFAEVAHYPADVKLVLIILGVGLLWQSVVGVLWSFFQGIEMMRYPSYANIIVSFSVAAFSIIALMLGARAVALSVVNLLCGIVALAVYIYFASRFLPSLPRVDWREALRLLKVGVPYFLNSLFSMIYFRVNSVMLSLMTTETVVGWSGAAYRFFDIMMFVPSIFSISVFPVMARHWEEKEALARMTRRNLDFILLAGIPIGIGTFGFAPQIISLVFGLKGYAPSIVVLRILSAGMVLVYLTMMLGTTLLAADRQRHISVIAFLSVFVNVGLNFWLIPSTQLHLGNGGVGAGIATVVNELFIMVAMLIVMPRTVLRGARVDVQLKILAAGCLMGLCVWLAGIAGVHWIVSAIVATVVYCAALFALKAVGPSELELLRSVVPLEKVLAIRRKST